jgi:hypothetical protein
VTATNQPRQHEAGIIGRTLRLMLALLLAFMTYTAMRTEDKRFNVRLLAVVGALAACYTLLHFVIRRYGTRLHRWYGAGLALAPLVLVFAFGGPPLRVGCVAYMAISLLLQTVRGDGGSEVMAIPAAVFRRPTHLAGILFSPVDLVEKHLTGPGGLPG